MLITIDCACGIQWGFSSESQRPANYSSQTWTQYVKRTQNVKRRCNRRQHSLCFLFFCRLGWYLVIVVVVTLVDILAVGVLVLFLVVSVQLNETLSFFFLFELFRVSLPLMEFEFPHWIRLELARGTVERVCGVVVLHVGIKPGLTIELVFASFAWERRFFFSNFISLYMTG